MAEEDIPISPTTCVWCLPKSTVVCILCNTTENLARSPNVHFENGRLYHKMTGAVSKDTIFVPYEKEHNNVLYSSLVSKKMYIKDKDAQIARNDDGIRQILQRHGFTD